MDFQNWTVFCIENLTFNTFKLCFNLSLVTKKTFYRVFLVALHVPFKVNRTEESVGEPGQSTKSQCSYCRSGSQTLTSADMK